MSIINLIESKKYIVSWIVAVAMFMETLDATVIANALPMMAASFHTDALSLKLTMSSYLFSLAVFIPLSGWLADRWGTAKTFTIALTIFTISSIICAVSTTLSMMVFARFSQGIGGSMMMPVGRIILLKTFPKNELVKASSHITVPGLIGSVIGPCIGGLFVSYLSWRYIFIINVPFGLMGIFFAKKYIFNYKEMQKKFDAIGFILLSLSLLVLSYFLEYLINENIFHKLINLSIFSLLLISFISWSKRQKHPIIVLNLFNISQFKKGILGSFFGRLAVSSAPFVLPLFFQLGLGWTPLKSGFFSAPQAIGMILGNMLIRKILIYLGFKQLLFVNAIIIGLTLILFNCIDSSTTEFFIIILVISFGFFSAIQLSTSNLLVYSTVNTKDSSSATTINSIIQQYSGSIAITIAGVVLGFFLNGNSAFNHTILYAFHFTFSIISFWSLLAALVFLTLSKEDDTIACNETITQKASQ